MNERADDNETMIYLDHSATTPIAPEVLDAMWPVLREGFANPSGAYAPGRAARAMLDSARRELADCLGCAPHEVVLTSGGSESDNLALRGVCAARMAQGLGTHLVSSAVEHEAVRETARDLARWTDPALAPTLVGVDAVGRVDVEVVMAALKPETALVSLMLANNEVGSLQPVDRLAPRLRERAVLLHTDAVQAAAWMDLDVDRLGVDLMSLSAHKFYGPKGVGLLYVREGTRLACAQTGGGQEEGRRSGTENLAGAVGMAAALRLVTRERAAVRARVSGLRERLREGLAARIEDIVFTGHPEARLPGHLSLCVAGAPADALLMGLDLQGICASSGSACASGRVEASPVLLAMGIPERLAKGALRFSLGRSSSERDVDAVIATLPPLVERLRAGA